MKQDEMFECSTLVHVYWVTLYLTETLMVIHMAAQTTSEVCTDHFAVLFLGQAYLLFWNNL